jgi:hypothetical protein
VQQANDAEAAIKNMMSTATVEPDDLQLMQTNAHRCGCFSFIRSVINVLGLKASRAFGRSCPSQQPLDERTERQRTRVEVA